MKKVVYFAVLFVLLFSTFSAAIAQAPQKPATPPENVAELGAEGAGINSLSGSYVEFDSSVGGDACYVPGGAGTFCFRAESFTNDWEYVYDVWEKFPADWVVNNAYVVGTPACTGGGTWGTFSWSFETSPYEVDIYHPRYQSTTDHCVAYYCFDVTAGAGPMDTGVAWYWDGDDYANAPHAPCSIPGYTPPSMSGEPCDEMINPEAVVPVCNIEPGVYLMPVSQEGSGCEGDTVDYTLNLYNNTGADGTFALSYAGVWPISGPADIFAANGATEPFQVTVTIPCGGVSDTGTVAASGNGYSDSSTVTTGLYGGGWAALPGSAPSWAGGGYPRDACTALNGAGEWVTYLLGDTSGIFGFWGYNHALNTWFQPGAANTPADRWAPDWAYDPATNLCYVTGGANTPGGGTYNTAYVFDPVANAFTALGSFTSIRDFHNSWVGTIDGVKYLCIGGGVNSASALIQATQCYDLNQAPPGVWNAENAQMAAFPTDPFGAADGVLHAAGGDQFWYVGGAINAFATVTDEARYWDDADNAWHLAGNTGVPRYRVEGEFLDGSFYQLGGSSGGFTYTGDAVVGEYDGANWIWTVLDPLSNARMDNVVTVAEDTIWSVDGYGASSANYVEKLDECPPCQGGPDIAVNPTSLSAEQCPDQITTQTLQICNVGGADLTWSLSEQPLVGSMPFKPVAVSGGAPNADLAVSSPAAPLVKPAPSANPEAVLWDQPLSSVNQNAYVNQDFEDYPTYSSFLADDFENAEAWDISTIFVPGNGWNGFSSLYNATSLTWQIYADNGGVPAGDPSGGGNPPLWTLTLAPTDGQVTITTGSGGLPSNTLLTLAAPVTVPAGHWWLVFYPTLNFGNYGQFGRQAADTLNGYVGQFINPGGAFGYGTAWQAWTVIGPTQQDIAFRLEGEVGGGADVPWLSEDPTGGTVAPGACQDVTVTFDSTGLAFGDYFADLIIDSNDPDEPTVTVPVHLSVIDCAANPMHINRMKMNWRLAGMPGYVKVIAQLRVHDADHFAVEGAMAYGEWTYPDTSVHPATAIMPTDALGRTKFRVKEPLFGDYEFCVTDIVLAGYYYNPAANEDGPCVTATTAP